MNYDLVLKILEIMKDEKITDFSVSTKNGILTIKIEVEE